MKKKLNLKFETDQQEQKQTQLQLENMNIFMLEQVLNMLTSSLYVLNLILANSAV